MYDEGKDIDDTTIDMSYRRQACDMVLQDFINALMDDKLNEKNIIKHLKNKYSNAHKNAKAHLRAAKEKKKVVKRRLEGMETKKQEDYNLIDMANNAIMKNINEDIIRVIKDIRILNQGKLIIKNYKDTFVEFDTMSNFYTSTGGFTYVVNM
jgi:archaellum biogenesis ATPase FlaH